MSSGLLLIVYVCWSVFKNVLDYFGNSWKTEPMQKHYQQQQKTPRTSLPSSTPPFLLPPFSYTHTHLNCWVQLSPSHCLLAAFHLCSAGSRRRTRCSDWVRHYQQALSASPWHTPSPSARWPELDQAEWLVDWYLCLYNTPSNSTQRMLTMFWLVSTALSWLIKGMCCSALPCGGYNVLWLHKWYNDLRVGCGQIPRCVPVDRSESA